MIIKSEEQGWSPTPAILYNMIYLQISSGLEYLHRHEIPHLDIKPPNVLVWEFPLHLDSQHDLVDHAREVLVKIADYGTSRIFTMHGIMANNSTSTPGYMAPESFSHPEQFVDPYKVCLSILTNPFHIALVHCVMFE